MSASLTQAIYKQRADWYAYLAASMEDDDAPKDYLASWHRLENWNAAASGPSEAAEALRLALEEYDKGDSPLIKPMMKAALGFLEGGDA